MPFEVIRRVGAQGMISASSRPKCSRWIFTALLAVAVLDLAVAKEEEHAHESGSKDSPALIKLKDLDGDGDGKVSREELQKAAPAWFQDEDEDEDEEEEEEEEEGESMDAAGVANIAVACTLLGGVAFIMGIFYMVNHSDVDMKLYSWQVVSCTVSIFVANLFFHAIHSINEVTWESLLPEGLSKSQEHFWELCSLLILFFMCSLAFQLFVYLLAFRMTDQEIEAAESNDLGALLHAPKPTLLYGTTKSRTSLNLALAETDGEHQEHGQHLSEAPQERTSISQAHGWQSEAKLEQTAEQRERPVPPLQCFPTLFAHVCGFAAMHGGYALQIYFLETWHVEAREDEADYKFGQACRMFSVTLLPVGAVFLVLFFLFRISDQVRSVWVHKRVERFYGVLDDCIEESENDIGALAISFLIVQSIRAFVTGYYPKTTAMHCPRLRMVIQLAVVSGSCAVIRLGMVKLPCFKVMESHEASADMTWGSYLKRWAFLVQAITSMIFAWCLLATIQDSFSYMLCSLHCVEFGIDINGASVRALMAMVISISVFAIIFLLDFISDKLHEMGNASDVERGIRGIIRSLGILVGFSWEQAFAHGMEDIIDHERDVAPGNKWAPVCMQLALALIVGVGTVPAWRWYILRNMVVLQAKFKKEEEVKQLTFMKTRSSLEGGVLPPVDEANEDSEGRTESRALIVVDTTNQ